MATTDPATLPETSSWYLATNLPRPGSAPAEEWLVEPADLTEIVRLYGLRNWVEQSYKQAKHQLGWADFQVRQDAAIRRHWELVCCAFAFCWWARFRQPEASGASRADPPPAGIGAPCAAPAEARSVVLAEEAKAEEKAVAPRAEPHCGVAVVPEEETVSWPQALRRVRGWLLPWSFLWHCLRAWSDLPPPPPL